MGGCKPIEHLTHVPFTYITQIRRTLNSTKTQPSGGSLYQAIWPIVSVFAHSLPTSCIPTSLLKIMFASLQMSAIVRTVRACWAMNSQKKLIQLCEFSIRGALPFCSHSGFIHFSMKLVQHILARYYVWYQIIKTRSYDVLNCVRTVCCIVEFR